MFVHNTSDTLPILQKLQAETFASCFGMLNLCVMPGPDPSISLHKTE